MKDKIKALINRQLGPLPEPETGQCIYCHEKNKIIRGLLKRSIYECMIITDAYRNIKLIEKSLSVNTPITWDEIVKYLEDK